MLVLDPSTSRNRKKFFPEISSTMPNGPLDDDKTYRGWSNYLDEKLGTSYENPKDSKIRGTVHAAYHGLMGLKNDNPREYERAKDQWNTAWGGPTDNLAKYDAANNYNNSGKK